MLELLNFCSFRKMVKMHLDNLKYIAYNKDAKSGATDRRLRPQIRLLKDLTALALECWAVISCSPSMGVI